MKLRALLTYVDEATIDGDLTQDSPVFAVVRNGEAPLDSEHAWHAISIVGLAADAGDGKPVLVADPADAAVDISVKALSAALRGLGDAAMGRTVLVDTPVVHAGASTQRERSEVVEAYGDEHGLGLMLPFDGYQSWLDSQG